MTPEHFQIMIGSGIGFVLFVLAVGIVNRKDLRRAVRRVSLAGEPSVVATMPAVELSAEDTQPIPAKLLRKIRRSTAKVRPFHACSPSQWRRKHPGRPNPFGRAARQAA